MKQQIQILGIVAGLLFVSAIFASDKAPPENYVTVQSDYAQPVFHKADVQSLIYDFQSEPASIAYAASPIETTLNGVEMEVGTIQDRLLFVLYVALILTITGILTRLYFKAQPLYNRTVPFNRLC